MRRTKPPAFSKFSKLPPNVREMIWEEAFGHSSCLHVFYAQVKRGGTRYRFKHSYAHSEIQYITSEPELKPEVNLGRVNREARKVVGRYHHTLSIEPRVPGQPGVVAVDTREDMFYIVNLKHSIQAMTTPLQQNIQIGQNLRHLSLPLFEIAYWPDKDTQASFDPSLRPTDSPWLLPGLPAALTALPSLQTLRLVVDRLFRVPFGIAYRRIPRRKTNLVGTRTELRALAKAQPRDAYGFSDYDAFVVAAAGDDDDKKKKLGYEWPIKVPGALFVHAAASTDDGLPWKRVLPFPRYDRFARVVRRELRRLLRPPLFSGRRVDVRLVVDLDSNANARSRGARLRVPDETKTSGLFDEKTAGSTTGGYDRYFASELSVLDWYADVSGHEREVKGYEKGVSADGKVVQVDEIGDPDFVVPADAPEVDELSNNSGDGSYSDSGTDSYSDSYSGSYSDS
ncbi:hypothetical protein PG997_014749 [Apiospora hydei]|uniref:2EXR domain-containing protein n=1 Tax=Apiospora hydei TaxID=1337664 RepID=A0ABR1UUT6_9PEZI